MPRGAFTLRRPRELRPEVGIPVCASNRITMPDLAEQVIADGSADLVSMARPFLADPDWVAKAAADRADEINTCIACNQACLDHTFANKTASCLVNPRAVRETELVLAAAPRSLPATVAVVGAGPAGLAPRPPSPSAATRSTLFEKRPTTSAASSAGHADPRQGGVRRDDALLPPAARARCGVKVHLGRRQRSTTSTGFDEVVVATGVEPRMPDVPGIDHPGRDLRRRAPRRRTPGRRVAVIGAGGIGVDVCELPHPRRVPMRTSSSGWPSGASATSAQIDGHSRRPHRAQPRTPSPREVHLLQRKTSMIGKDLGKTSGWVHRAALKARGVEQVSVGVSYERIDDARPAHHRGPHEPAAARGRRRRGLRRPGVGQPLRPRRARGPRPAPPVHLIGGADVAAELDAKRAIEQGLRVAADA